MTRIPAAVIDLAKAQGYPLTTLARDAQLDRMTLIHWRRGHGATVAAVERCLAKLGYKLAIVRDDASTGAMRRRGTKNP